MLCVLVSLSLVRGSLLISKEKLLQFDFSFGGNLGSKKAIILSKGSINGEISLFC